MTTIAEEHEFEARQLAESLARQIDGIIADLETMKSHIETDSAPYEHYMPMQSLIDLAMRYGELIQMRRWK